jgi:hypothetical protein
MPFSPGYYQSNPGNADTVMGEAWIDSKTLLPVALDDGFMLATYTFKTGPTEPMGLPPGFKELYKSYKINKRDLI